MHESELTQSSGRFQARCQSHFDSSKANVSFVADDGGRLAAGFKGQTGDCVTRAITIASGLPYRAVYDALYDRIREFAETSKCRAARRASHGNGRSGSTPRNGVNRRVYDAYLKSLGFRFVATMGIGTGCRVHLRADELPAGRLVVRLSKHLAAVIDGVIHDTHDCSREGTRCVYGYYVKEASHV